MMDYSRPTTGLSRSGGRRGCASPPGYGCPEGIQCPVAIPNLPGFRTTPATAKTTQQSLRVQNGYMLVNSGSPTVHRPMTAPMVREMMSSSRSATSLARNDAVDRNDLSGRYSLASQQRDRNQATRHPPFGNPDDLPNFLKYDRKVLCFHAYYEERINESSLERQRTRKCLIYYYLENDTIQMVEPTEENSGLPQGPFIRRHRIPRPDAAPGAYYEARDLFVGAELEVYKKYIKIYDCDAFTSQFCAERQGRRGGGSGRVSPQDDATVLTEDEGGGDALDAMSRSVSGAALPCPEGEYNSQLRVRMQRETGADMSVSRNRTMHPMKQFMEAQLGKPSSEADLGMFLAHGRQVLRFECVWDDSTQLYGDVHSFKLHYFLSDDTIEILQVHEKNNGRDPVPKLLRRRKLAMPLRQEYEAAGPLAPPPDARARSDRGARRGGGGDCGGGDDVDDPEYAANDTPGGPKHEGYFHWTDLWIGKRMRVYNRDLLLVAADGFTRSYYEQERRPLADDAARSARFAPDTTQTAVPPFNGFGSEEDSLRSVYSIRPKKPTRDLSKSASTGHVMRFSARILHAREEDAKREFTLTYYLIDDTMAVREPPLRNSGHIGGNFLSRAKVKKPDQEQQNSSEDERQSSSSVHGGKRWGPAPYTAHYAASDLYVGAVLEFLGHEFQVTQADEWALRYMEERGAPAFPRSDASHVERKLADRKPDLRDALRTAHQHLRDETALQDALLDAGLNLSQQECITLARAARIRDGAPQETGPFSKQALSEVLDL